MVQLTEEECSSAGGGGGDGICPGPFILMASPSKGWDDSPKGTSLQSIYSLLKNPMIVFIKM